ncbi:YggT family protein [Thalassotalea agariperforans]
MQAINYLLDFIFEALVVVLILRVWLQAVRADFYNPLSQFIVKVTNPVVIPFRRVLPSIGALDTATLLLAFIFSALKFIVIPLINGAGLDLFTSFYLGFIALIKQTGVLLFMLMLVMAIMSWVVQGYNPTLAIFHQLTEPFLKPIRNIIPSIGGLDLSILVAFLLLNVINILLSGAVPYWGVI